jgi:hypothetical protein
VQTEELRLQVYEWGKNLNNEDALALARRLLDIHKSAMSCARSIEELSLARDAREQSRIVTNLEIDAVQELAGQIALAAPLFEKVSGHLNSLTGETDTE